MTNKARKYWEVQSQFRGGGVKPLTMSKSTLDYSNNMYQSAFDSYLGGFFCNTLYGRVMS